MKRILIFLIFLLSYSVSFGQEDTRIYVVIDGIPATDETYEKVQNDTTAVMHFLPASKAVPLYGPVAAKGALLITTGKTQETAQPIFLQKGRRINPDSIDYSTIQRIDVIRGQQAINLYGPAGRDGVFLLQERDGQQTDVFMRITDDQGKQQIFNLNGPDNTGVFRNQEPENQPVDVILRLTNDKGNPLRRVKVISENGSILAESDTCGWVMLENFSLGNTVTLSAGKKKSSRLVVDRQVMNVKL